MLFSTPLQPVIMLIYALHIIHINVVVAEGASRWSELRNPVKRIFCTGMK